MRRALKVGVGASGLVVAATLMVALLYGDIMLLVFGAVVMGFVWLGVGVSLMVEPARR